MRHGMHGRAFRRYSAHRKAMFENLAASLLKHEQIRTTLPKAKDLRPIVERLITLGRRGGLHVRRQAIAMLQDEALANKLVTTLAERYRARPGGYTRIVRLGNRKGDGAEQAMIELVGSELVKRAAERAKRREEKLQALRQGKDDGEAPEE